MVTGTADARPFCTFGKGDGMAFRSGSHVAVLLLLVIAVGGCGTTPHSAGLAAELPLTPVERAQRSSYTVQVAPDGSASVSGSPCPPAHLVPRLKSAGASLGDRIVISASSRVRYSAVVGILTALQEAGFRSVGVRTEK